MSGSSLDGLDVCYCRFEQSGEVWSFKLLLAETFVLPEALTRKLGTADSLASGELLALDVEYGEWIGAQLKGWIQKNHLLPLVMGIHGHTVFHNPDRKISIQIGSGLMISSITGLAVVDAFRTLDVYKGGQGAPLVPAGEHYLFKGSDAFVNLGGIANVSVHTGTVKAWDIAPCNQILNHFSQKLGHSFDKNGDIARSGSMDTDWFEKIAGLEYFQRLPPKSLSNQWRQNILEGRLPAPETGLHTYTRFLAGRIAQDLIASTTPSSQVLVTGGGAFNAFLIEELRANLPRAMVVVVPDESIINFKEALIFGFLGLLRYLKTVNVFCSVTGASEDSIAGTLHFPG